MTHPQLPRKSPPSPWAVALFIASSGFALISIALISTGYIPL